LGWQSKKYKIKASGTGAIGDNPAREAHDTAAKTKGETQRGYWAFLGPSEID